ncbi:hypothetical protein K8I28_06075 [bacterium]|nr:hypothetical protein [bacterium]
MDQEYNYPIGSTIQLAEWGYTTCNIYGGMNPHEHKRAEKDMDKTKLENGVFEPLWESNLIE